MYAVVLKANPYRAKNGRYTSKDKAFAVTTFDKDMEAQANWLLQKAKENGKATLEQLMLDNMDLFVKLGKQWRRGHTFVNQ